MGKYEISQRQSSLLQEQGWTNNRPPFFIDQLHNLASSTDSRATDAYPRVRYGKAGRDYNVYTINSIPKIQSGDSYYFRQYLMMGEFNDMAIIVGTTYSPSVEENQYAAGARTGRVVKLYSEDGWNKFGFALGSDSYCGSSRRRNLWFGAKE